MSLIQGTSVDVEFDRVVDGDTIKVILPGESESESLRILALDTEESWGGGAKPATPWGKKAKEFAIQYFANARQVTIEFPGNESVDVCIRKYRGNNGRLLVFVHYQGEDYQECMIRKGYSPYFTKYGNVKFAGHHHRYKQAEREAQQNGRGMWDQVAVNGSVIRDYPALTTWWKLRARVIDEYRATKASAADILNTRLDYETLVEKAVRGEAVTIFAEISGIRRVGGEHGLIACGSEHRPFNLFVPQMDAGSGSQVINLLNNRYIGKESAPSRSYAYITGELALYDNRLPQMVIRSVDQLGDDAPVSAEGGLKIVSLLPDPEGRDAGKEQVKIRNFGAAEVSIQGWVLQDGGGKKLELDGVVPARGERLIQLPAYVLQLNNDGDQLSLFNAAGDLQSSVSYTENDVLPGHEISFEPS